MGTGTPGCVFADAGLGDARPGTWGRGDAGTRGRGDAGTRHRQCRGREIGDAGK